MVDGLAALKRQTPEERRAYEETYDRVFKKNKKNDNKQSK